METTTFTGVRSVAVPVTDQDRAKATFVSLGFAEVFDTELQPGFRWVELATPGEGTHLALVASGAELPVGIDTGIRLETADAAAARDAVAAAGLVPDELLDWEGVPLMFSFVDHDGNRLYVAETSS